MTKWEYATTYSSIRRKEGSYNVSDPTEVWNNKGKSGKTGWDSITKFGADGWELVSVTPITEDSQGSSFTSYLVYTFKRPLD